MTTTRFSRFGRSPPPVAVEEVEDYIPYNGPYSPPPSKEPVRVKRNSWGEVIVDSHAVHEAAYGEFGEEPQSYGRGLSPTVQEWKGRNRAASSVTSHTTSTYTDTRAIPRRATQTASRPIMDLDGGGVGLNPIPLSPKLPPSSGNNRMSFASFFTFGSGKRNTMLESPPTSAPLSTTHHPIPSDWPHHQKAPRFNDEGEIYRTMSAQTDLPEIHIDTISPQNHKHSALPTPRHPYAVATPQRIRPPSPKATPSHLKLAKPSQAGHSLKASSSTPNLRGNPRSPKPAATPKRKNQWFAAETWCDVLLPRPRFVSKAEGDSNADGDRRIRIVSPPDSPLQPAQKDEVERWQPRKIHKARSMANLAPSGPSTPAVPMRIQLPAPGELLPPNQSKPSRPRSFAFDDLALPSPIPSLAKVLEDGDKMMEERQVWNAKATSSFANKQTRSVSRSRAKSFGHAKYKEKHGAGNMDILAARTFLGGQTVPALVFTPKLPASDGHGTEAGTSITNSRGNTHSRQSSGAQGSHHRAASLGKSAVRLAKSSPWCGVAGENPAFVDDDNPLDSAIRGDSTKVVRLGEPAVMEERWRDNSAFRVALSPPLTHSSAAGGVNGRSPTPSGGSEGIGLAIGTPSEVSVSTYEFEHISHPYAQNYVPSAAHQRILSSDYAGPHPTTPLAPSANLAVQNDILRRHRLPPQANFEQRHPYAAKRISPHPRVDSDVAYPAKMWAATSTGEVREVLPTELQYSPYMLTPDGPEDDALSVARAYARQSLTRLPSSLNSKLQPIRRESGDSVIVDINPNPDRDGPPLILSSPESRSIRRKPVEYGAHSPVDLKPRLTRTPSSPLANVSITSSPQQSPKPFGDPDDLAGFENLFYRPNPNDLRGYSSESQRMSDVSQQTRPREDEFPGRSSTFTSRSGLTSLARQLSADFKSLRNQSLDEGSILAASDLDVQRDSLPFTFTDHRPGKGTLPLRLPQRSPERSSYFGVRPVLNIPEDVAGSSRASSILERSPVDGQSADDHRMGAVAVSTPLAVANAHRVSHHLSLDDETLQAQIAATIRASLQPPEQPHSAARYSDVSTSSLSDFPNPPPAANMTPAHTALMDSYFARSPENQENDPFMVARPVPKRTHTFGQLLEEDPAQD